MPFFRAANPIWTVFDIDGKLAAGGRIDTYRSADKGERKATYLDPAGTNAAPNPLRLDGIGQLATEIYWNDDEKYYLELYDFFGRLIRTIDNFPDASSGGGSSVVGLDFENHLQNGQFRIHNQEEYDPLTADETTVAPYWTFHKNNVSATDRIVFNRINLGDDTEGSPIYEINYICTGQGTGETFKDFKQKMADVRTFEQSIQTFSMQVYSDVPRIIEVFFLQHFGTGGSPSADALKSIGSFNLTGGIEEKIHNSITIPSVAGMTRGTNNDDYVAIVIRMPLDTIANIRFTNCYLSSTDKVLPYPRLTKEKEDSEMLGAMIPDVQDGDHGKVITANRDRMYSLEFPVPVGAMIEYGGQSYADDDYWGICYGETVSVYQDSGRYSRLFSAIGHSWGRGTDAWLATSNGNKVTLLTSSASPVTPPQNGPTSPGFTIYQFVAASSSRTYFIANAADGNLDLLEVRNYQDGIVLPINNTGAGLLGAYTHIAGSAERPEVSTAQAKPGASLTGGQYFTAHNPIDNVTIWYRVDGAGAAPSVTGVVHVVDVANFDTASEVGLKTLAYLAGYQVDIIETQAASSIAAGSYINVNTSSNNLYLWFRIGGIGSDPKISGKTGLMVEFNSGDDASQVAAKIANKLDGIFFKKPDRRSFFARGHDPSKYIDEDNRIGTGVGSRQYDELHYHSHDVTLYQELSDFTGDSYPASRWTNIATKTTGWNQDVNHGGSLPAGQGGYETRPINVAVNYLIKL